MGDLSKQISADARDAILDLKNTVRRMVVRLRMLATEVTRVIVEVGPKESWAVRQITQTLKVSDWN